MHRELSPHETPFRPRSNLGIYGLTSFCVLLLLLDLSPYLANVLSPLGLDVPKVAPTLFGLRLALLAAILGGTRALFGGLERLSEGKLGADLAIALACIAAIWLNEPLVAAEVVVIGLVGECLEAWTFARAQRSLAGLVELFPIRCWVLRDGVEVRTLTADLLVNDTIVVKPGGRLPADGVVVAGHSSVDEAALTGESIPVEKGPKDFVLAGSVNQLGTLTYTATKLAKETAAGRVIDLTASALKDKAPIERTADRLAKYFLPAVLGLAALTFAFHFFWQPGNIAQDGRRMTNAAAARLALYPALAVLVVACPCPLVLATPTAILAALARLRGTGVLPKGGAALERLAKITTIAFDKTGTLTAGIPEVAEIVSFSHFNNQDILRLAAIAETGSEHPLAKAIITAHANIEQRATEFQAVPGAGVIATVENEPVLVGTAKFLLSQGLTVGDSVTAILQQMDAAGQTAVLVARGGEIIGAISVMDRIRPEARGVLEDLKALGLSPITVITGDRTAAANAALAGLPIDVIHAECLPEDKANFVASATTAYVGDGLNDAPALARAGVGLAVAGTDLAAEAGDVVLMGDPLRHLPFLVRLSRETVRIIHQNIVWFGFSVNLLGVLLAGWLWPLFAGSSDAFDKAPLVGVIYHQLGSLLVLLNSLRLLAFEQSSRNTTVRTVRDSARHLDRWLNTLHAEDLWHWVSHNFKTIAVVVLGIGFIGWMASGLNAVQADEVAVVKRFGAIRETLEPGLHVRFPWPIEEAYRFKPNEPRMVAIGYRPLSAERTAIRDEARQIQQTLRTDRPTPEEATWASSHTAGATKLTDESLMLTGDGNLLEVQATVRYRIANPAQYMANMTDADNWIRAAGESVLRELAAAQALPELLTTARPAFEAQALNRLTTRLGRAGYVGIAIDGITVHDLHPPQQVVAAYHGVAEAIQNRDRVVNEAMAEATRTRQRSRDEALRLVRSAEADATRKTREAEATRDSFLAWVKARVIPAAQEPDATKRAALQKTRQQLTEFRLALSAVTSALAGRDKVIVDAETVPGRRSLWLFDPSFLRTPAASPPPESSRP